MTAQVAAPSGDKRLAVLQILDDLERIAGPECAAAIRALREEAELHRPVICRVCQFGHGCHCGLSECRFIERVATHLGIAG